MKINTALNIYISADAEAADCHKVIELEIQASVFGVEATVYCFKTEKPETEGKQIGR